ncbi:hypothetical protein TREMEDRAFT_70962 [Tremella mesenterica DSM 1558]|uniref:uncharacterized protein n=1 Tax=Tremella mesenterica (strain ATCC 24925 / CBS 8224 / DSM 1558 / NBRC 9311 / NRRL Y-6157 / RJB 2259-6 / UBC 559-6) TaxID=578456 RepID=UPI0003F48EDB|nr:uncharacterized protein TREMEDRAFT_70962 [Tremella mesenterica DSM 1558]EIW73387.1 hypothetical protein TREMEDRAFT_70962 [Tremella mesenterica DSM 1558]
MSFNRPQRRAAQTHTTYAEDSDVDADGEFDPEPIHVPQDDEGHYEDDSKEHITRSGRHAKRPERYHPEDDNFISSPPEPSRRNSRKSKKSSGRRRTHDDEDDGMNAPHLMEDRPRRMTRHSAGSESDDPLAEPFVDDDQELPSTEESPPRLRRRSERNARSSGNRRTVRTEEPSRRLRARTNQPNYQLPPLDISAEIGRQDDQPMRPSARSRGLGAFGNGAGFGPGAATKGLPWALKGGQLARAMGDPDTSDSVCYSHDDEDFLSPMKNATGVTGSGVGSSGRVGPATGAPTDVPNFGRINPKSSTADADPLGVDMNVTFDNVGGLDDHINQLKEMVALPLLYPELFQQFGITPPRGVLFHGPPGTGKTLLARALAASCSTGNTKIAFFMRKGADVLSKWVGEAERQLRMLFEEARAAQPSIIFFDEIDGLAPVRSSKQDQIHASLVSTLLALMDGMDGRGQVIVIGATNRPDAVDSALRRPGRFDREFYFPLPNRAARKKIIGINTRKWSPPLSDQFLEHLATLTKGYGGADLRALCTEAALNAIQRRYPQIYKTPDRLQLETGSIHVKPKDFMLSLKKIVPSSARASSSVAVQLPQHLTPLLERPLTRLKEVVDLALPPSKNKTALEEAEFEDDDDSFEKHAMLQALDKLRTFRPRILVYGSSGMGQNYLGPAILHHLEGFHVQSFDLGTLMSDSTRTTEAVIVQTFVEAKRHQPSIIYIPSLAQWAATLSEVARATVKALLDSVPPSDPVLLLALVDGSLETLPRDVREWFGHSYENRVELIPPTVSDRSAYFADLIASFHKPPTAFPDAIPRRKRILETLPLADPLPPRQPSEAEIARDLERDNQARQMMILSFASFFQELGKKYRKVAASVREDAMGLSAYLAEEAAGAVQATQPGHDNADINVTAPNGNGNGDSVIEVTIDDLFAPPPTTSLHLTNPETQPPVEPAPPVIVDASAPQPDPATSVWQAHDIDLDVIQHRLLKHKYHTPTEVLADVRKIEQNAEKLDVDRQARIADMAANIRMHVASFDPKWTPEFERYSLSMRARKAEREKQKAAEATTISSLPVNPEIAPIPISIPVPSLTHNGVPENVMEVPTIVSGPSGTEHVQNGDEDVQMEDSPSLKRSREESLPPLHLDKRPRNDPIISQSTEHPSYTSLLSPSVPPPRPVEEISIHPPFVLPQSHLDILETELTASTGDLNVEQLEQLRAMLFDRIWRKRGEWDRTGVIDECRRVVERFVKEIGKMEEEF